MPKLNLKDAKAFKGPWGDTKAIKGPGFIWTKPSMGLSNFYGIGEGKIGIHLSTEKAVLDTTGKMIGIINAGGAGAYFDATVVGAPLVIDDKTVLMNGSETGVPELSASASLIDVRLMWVSTITATNQMRFFGDLNAAGGVSDYEIRLNVSGTDFAFQLFDNEGGVGGVVTLLPRVTAPSGLHLFEIEVSTATGLVTAYMDSVQIGNQVSWPGAFSQYYIRRIGQGTGTTLPFVGTIGDVLGVTLGAGADQTIDAARSYLKAKFGIS